MGSQVNMLWLPPASMWMAMLAANRDHNTQSRPMVLGHASGSYPSLLRHTEAAFEAAWKTGGYGEMELAYRELGRFGDFALRCCMLYRKCRGRRSDCHCLGSWGYIVTWLKYKPSCALAGRLQTVPVWVPEFGRYSDGSAGDFLTVNSVEEISIIGNVDQSHYKLYACKNN